MLAAITRTLTSRGYVPPARLEQALRAKALHGGSLGLNLVLLGDLSEELLARAWSTRLGLPRATADDLSEVESTTFELLPIEIIYDTGLLPLRRVGEAKLLVGVADPVDPERLDEAQFFAGMEVEACTITATEMASAFESFAGQPWKRRVDELRAAQARVRGQVDDSVLADVVASLCGVDSELEQALFGVDLDRSIALQVGALASDPPSRDRQPPATGDAERVHTRTELVAPSDVSPDSIVELGEAERKAATTPVIGSGRVQGESGSMEAEEQLIELEVPAAQPDAPTRPMEALRRRPDDAIPTEPLEPVARVDGARARVSGRSGAIPAFRDADGVERTADGRAATQSTLRLSGVNTAAPEVVDAASAPDVRMTPLAGVDVAPPGATDSFRAIRLPTVDGVDVTDFHGTFGPPVAVFDGTGTPSEVATAAFAAAVEAIDLTEDRDAIARDLAEVLSIVYPTVLVLSLRLPRLVLWAGHARRGPARLAGQRFDLQEGSVWHRVAAGAEAFRGRLATHDPLRVALGRELSDDTIAAPLLMKDRTVAIVVLDAGYLGGLPAACGLWESLERSVAAAFRRAIVQRKRSVRAV